MVYSDPFDPKKEQAIMASFRDPDQAQKVAKELQSMGIETIQIDRVSPYGGQPAEQLMNPITSKIPSLGELTLGREDYSSLSARILTAASVSASGYSTSAGEVTGEDILMTVVCPKDQVGHVVNVIRQSGGNT